MKRVLVLVVALATSGCDCSLDEPLALGDQCELTSECDAPLVCRIARCRKECATSRDCAAGLLCVRDQNGDGACQLPAEKHCALASDCPAPLICAMGECRNECVMDVDCTPGQACVVSPGSDGGAPVACSGTGAGCGCYDLSEDRPCVYSTECPTGLVCASDQRCRPECDVDEATDALGSHPNCRFGTVCKTVAYDGGGVSDVCEFP